MTCKPHHWRSPEVGDKWLTCDVCGRLLPFHELHPQHVRYGVLRAYARRLGRDAAKAFGEALSEALNHQQRRIHHDG